MRYFLLLLLCVSLSSVNAKPLTHNTESSLMPLNIKAARDQVSKSCSTDQGSDDTLKKIICSGQVRIGVRTNYKSFGELDGDKNVGFEIDLAGAIAKELGVRPIFVSVGPADRIAALLEKKLTWCWLRWRTPLRALRLLSLFVPTITHPVLPLLDPGSLTLQA